MTNLRDLPIALPPRWRHRPVPGYGVLVHARARVVPPSGSPPELVLHSTPVADDLIAWRRAALAALADRLDGFDLEDEDAYDLEGRPVVYARFGHRLGLADLVSEQWSWRTGDRGVTLTGTVARADYADYCEVFEAVTATFEPGPLAA